MKVLWINHQELMSQKFTVKDVILFFNPERNLKNILIVIPQVFRVRHVQLTLQLQNLQICLNENLLIIWNKFF